MGTAGMPDILLIDSRGQIEGIEVKRNNRQKLNPNQVAMANQFASRHVSFHVTSDPEYDSSYCRQVAGVACYCWEDWA